MIAFCPLLLLCCLSVASGRAKDTIVLLSGKNVEPQPIEDALTQSPLIK
jgi:long-chain acyl-CoA synthetase